MPDRIKIVSVRFRPAGKLYEYLFDESLELQDGDDVIVELDKGEAYASVVQPPRMVDRDPAQLYRHVIRRATEQDMAMIEANDQLEIYAFDLCKAKIIKHGLPMKLVRVEYLFDASKITFYFTAEGRIDFRELVKDLAHEFRTRIEMRQIGVRDETKLLGGFGPCGRPCCCATFLRDFAPVSIRMAKEQNLNLSPSKISGLCGRLMCCLTYEHSQYAEALAKMPEVDTRFEGERVRGMIRKCNPLTNTLLIETDDGRLEEINLATEQSLSRSSCPHCGGGKCRTLCRQDQYNRMAPEPAPQQQVAADEDYFSKFDLSDTAFAPDPEQRDHSALLAPLDPDGAPETAEPPRKEPAEQEAGQRPKRSGRRRGGRNRNKDRGNSRAAGAETNKDNKGGKDTAERSNTGGKSSGRSRRGSRRSSGKRSNPDHSSQDQNS